MHTFPKEKVCIFNILKIQSLFFTKNFTQFYHCFHISLDM